MTPRAGSPEWLAERRGLVTATDIPIILGLSPYKSEAQLAAEKLGQSEPDEPTLRMRLGRSLEPFIAEEYSRMTGLRLRRFTGLVHHPSIAWAAATPDYRAVGRKLDVEIKWHGGRSRFADGLPQDYEAQVRWQLGVLGYQQGEVAALVVDELRTFPVEHDEAQWRKLVDIAADFRRRLEAGGPFTEDAASLRARYPSDDGTEMTADAELAEAVSTLVALREKRKAIEADEEHLEVAIKQRMGDAASLVGPGFHVTWKRTRDHSETDWKLLAEGLLRQLPETERDALVGLHSTVRSGFRPFRVWLDKED
jgi:putative phage-type endonuclease